MPVTVNHVLTATTPDDPNYEIRPSHWNSAHVAALSATAGTEIFGAFSNDPAYNVSFSTNGAGQVVASANVTAAPSPVNVTGANGSSVNAQTIAFSNANGMTLGVSTAANGATVTGSYTVPSTAGLLSAVKVSAGTTSNNLSALTFSNAAGAVNGGVNWTLNASTIQGAVQDANVWFATSNTTVSSQGNISLFGGGVIRGAGNVSVGFSNANGEMIISGSQTVQTQASGNIAGSGVTTAGNNIGLSGTLNSAGLSLSATVAAQSAQTQSNVQGIIVSNTTYRTGDVSFSNANGMSFGSSAGQAITASYTVPTVTDYFSKTNTTFNGANISGSMTLNTNGLQLSMSVAAPGGAASETFYATGNTTVNSSGTMALSSMLWRGYGIVSLGTSNGSLLVSTPDPVTVTQLSVGISTVGNTSGNTGLPTDQLIFAGGNNITLSGSTNGGSMTITISGANAGGAQTGISGIQVSNTTYTSGTVTFQNANGISFGSSGANGISASYTVPTQSNQTGGIYNSSQTTGASSSSTYDLRSITHVFSGNISGGWTNGSLLFNVTTAAQSNQTLGIYASSNTTGASSSSTYDARSLTIVGSDNISVGWTNGSLAIKGAAGGGVTPVASASNGSFSFTTLAFSNANNVTFGTSAGSIITASVAAPGAAAENNWVNLLGANTAGNTTASGSTIGYSGINLTLSGTNGSVVNISAPATSSLVGSNGVAVSTNGSTITVSQQMGSYLGNMEGQWPNSTLMTMLQSTSHVQPFVNNNPVSFGFIRMPVSMSVQASSTAATTGNTQFSYGVTRTHNFVLYSRGVGASSMSLQSVASTSLTDQQSINISANANSTQFSYTNRATFQSEGGTFGSTMDYSSSAASLNFHTSNMTGLSNVKMVAFPWASSLQPGQYWLMYGISSSTASQFTNQGTRFFVLHSQYGMSMPNLAFGTIGAATNSSVGPFFGLGSFTTNAQTTASLNISNVSTSGSHNIMFFQLANIA